MDRENISIPKHKYLKCDRETLKRLKIKSAQDPVGYLRQLGYESGRRHGRQRRPLKYDEKMPVLLEYESFFLYNINKTVDFDSLLIKKYRSRTTYPDIRFYNPFLLRYMLT